MKLALRAACLLMLGLTLGASPAAAQYSPAATVTVIVSDSTPGRGATVTVGITNNPSAPPGQQMAVNVVVTIDLFSDPVRLGSFTTDRNGNGQASVVIPANTTPGRHRIELRGTSKAGTPLTVSRAITVTGAAGATRPLPRTGSDNADLARMGAVLVVGGGAAAYAARRRLRSNNS